MTLPDIKIGQLRNFVAVVDQQGFKAAARSLHRSQPAISLSVKELENLIGAALFEKNMQSELTPFGRQFYVTAKKLLEQYNMTIRSAVDMVHLNDGQVRIAIVPSIAREVLPTTLTRFIASYPKIEVWVEDGDATYVSERVSSGSVDFGCSGTLGEDSRFKFTGVTKDVMGLVCSEKHPLAKLSEVKWEQLLGQCFITNGAMHLVDKELAAPLMATSTMHISNITSLLGLISANIGLTILPFLSIPKPSAGICFVPLKSPVVHRAIGILELANVSLNPAAERFRDQLMADMSLL